MQKEEYQTSQLSNGLRIIHKPDSSNVSYCGFFINAGTRDELSQECGMAHFVEHMLFKGTTKRRAYHIINRIENVGGELNAYTNKEETVIYSTFLEEHFERAIELLSDLVFNSLFPQNEINKEIDVVIDEIHSYEDSPSELIYDDFENLVFSDSQLGHNILGNPDLLETFTTENLIDFVSRNYLPENIVFFSMGKTSFSKILKFATKYLSNTLKEKLPIQRKVPTKYTPQKKQILKETSQVHAIIGGPCYSIHNPKRMVLYLLNNILGGPGMNSRLNMELRERRGFVYNVESSLTTYSDTGLFSIYFGADIRNANKCLDLIYKELTKFRNNKLSDLQLTAAKKQLIGQIGISNDNRENMALSLGKTYYHFGKINTQVEIFRKIQKISANDLFHVANEIFDEDNLSLLIYK